MTVTTSDCSCPEYSRVSRRGLFRGAALAGAVTTFGSAVVTTSAGSAFAAGPASSVLVVLSLRGAADGLSLVVPHGDPNYYAARPGIAVPKESLLARDAFFGFHPAMAPLAPLWTAGRLAAVHATGLPVPNRSHFAAMEEVEDADPGSSARVGWLNRLLGQDDDPSFLQGVAMGSTIPPTSLAGPESAMALARLDRLGIAGAASTAPSDVRIKSLGTAWGASGSAYATGVQQAVAGTTSLLKAQAQPDRASSYPATDLGRALSSVSRTLRAEIGVGMVTVDQGAWDMHTDVGTPSAGRLVTNARDLAGSIAAFFADLGPVADKVTLVTISEFGRRVQENASGGLDHGWGNVMLLAGAGVKGGKYYASWPGLQTGLDADLAVTTDYRSVLAEVVTTRMGASSAAVFPGFAPTRVGVMTGS